MKNNYLARRRGTSVAAAALSFALVAPFAQPVAFAQEETAVIAEAPAAEENDAIVADGIANGYVRTATGMTNAKSTLSGRAFIDDGYGFSPTDGGQQAVPEGTKVYMQWIDKDGAVSPVYVARTSDQLSKSNTSQAGPGSYVFDLREPWIDHHGKKHTYTASTNQYYRLWIDPFVDERNGFTVYPFRQVGGFFPGAYRNSMGADQQGAWNTIGTNMQRTAVLMQADRDVPYMHKPKADWIADTDPTVKNQAVSSAMKGHVGGKVWHETTDARLNGPNDTRDVPAKDMYVVMSVLTQEGIGAYADAVDTLPEAQRLAAAKKLLQEHPEYIAATVRSKIDEDGRYSVKFPEGTLTNETKDYLYAHVETADGVIPSAYSAWRVPLFNSPKNNGTRNPAPIAAENFVQNPMWYNVNFALVPRHDVTLDITNFNMTDTPADIGDTAKLDVTGPFPVTPNKIVWRKNGEIVKTCDDIDGVDDANACTITVPEDAETGDIFTAEFVTGDDTVLAADSFTVVVPVVLPFGSVKDEYNEFDALSVLPNEPDNKVEGAEPTYKVDGLPEGLTFDPETGKISGTPTKPGTSEVIVTRDIKVMVQEERPVLDEDGNPEFMDPSAPEDERVIKTETVDVEETQHDRVSALLTVTDSPLKAAKINVEYEQEVVPTGFESHPHKLKVKEGSIAVADLPAGLTFDAETGKITGTPTEEVEADEDNPNVTVTYTLVDHNDKEYEVTDRVPLPVGQPTTVDDSGVKPVDPTDEQQDTGIVVNNPDEDTKVSATDEDGKDVPVEIDDNGNVVVTPGEDVDGPITVIVEDPDLDGGKAEVEVPVNGHEKDRDDNNSDKKPEIPVVTPGDNTTVPADGDEYTVGTVENPKGDETGKLVDKDGNEIPGSKVEIDEDGNVKVTVPEGTDPQDGKVVVTDKDGNTVGEIDVNIVDPTSDAAKNVPNYGDRKGVEAGNTEESDPFEGKTDVPVKEASGTPSEGADDWAFEIDEKTGVVKATAPSHEKVGEKIESELPTIDSSWEKFVETFTPYARPSVTVEFTYDDESSNEATAGFDLLGKDGKSLLDPDGDFDGDGFTNKEEIEKGTNPADENSVPSEGGDVEDKTAPKVNPIKPGDKTISGTGDRPNEKIIVELPGGKKVETETDKDGKWTVKVPSDVELKPGDKVIVSDGAGNKATEQVGIDTGKCVATSLGFGLPLLALIPLGLASQMEIPGLSNVVADASAQLQAANTRIQQQLGLFNPEIAAQVDAANRQLAQFGTDIGTVAGGLALIAAGILAGTLIYDNCSPNGGGSSVKDLELKGSSGKTYAGSSKKDDKAGEKAADKK